jgi:two-component system chemotaxis sensor kinase CheA
MTPTESRTALTIPKLRSFILLCLVLGVSAFTVVIVSITQQLSRRFGPQVENDLRWRVARGAQELSHAAELGLAVADEKMVRATFSAYAQSDDVQAIVALASDGHVVAKHGALPEPEERLVRGAPGTVRAERGYLVSWADAQIEGVSVGKVALVVGTRRHTDALALLERAQLTVWIGGLFALALGSLLVIFFTRAVARRDAQLLDDAKNLERKVDERTRELDERNRGMRLVLDNVVKGFITIDFDGVMASERSAVLDRWFFPPKHGMRIHEYLADASPDFAAWLSLGLEQLRDDFLPIELSLDQLPKRFEGYGRTFDVSYMPIQHGERETRLLVMISDETEALARERAEREQRELVTLFERISVDRPGTEEFLREAADLVARVRTEEDPSAQKRLLHTLKGNCAIYGLDSYAQLAHQVESELAASEGGLSDAQRQRLVDMWKEAMRRVTRLLGGTRRDVIEVERSELEQLRARVQGELSRNELASWLTHWSEDPIAPRFARLAQQAGAIARQLDKPEPTVEVRADGIRLASTGFSPFFGALVHVLRNALDHGIESPEERVALSKPEAGSLALCATRREGKLSISVRDDGRGVNWQHVRDKARAVGLRHGSHEDLIEALFSDGFSTKDKASEISGRGVGLAALRETVQNLGGSIEIDSTPGKGTCFVFSFEEQSIARSRLKGSLPRSSLLPNLS